MHAVPLTLVAGIGHWLLGSVDWQIFIALIFGIDSGNPGRQLCRCAFPERALRIVLALTLLAVATKLSFELVPSPEVVAVQAEHH